MNTATTDVATIFALLYILAQAVERVVELISDFNIWGDPNSKDPAIIHRRAISLWVVSTAVGVIVCYSFGVDFFELLKVSKPGESITFLHGLISGIIVGSGTKPVHDVIASIEKYARKPS